MSVTQPPLQRQTLALELTQVTLAVQRAHKVEEALRVGAGGLEALGFDVAVVEELGGTYRLRYLSPRPELERLAAGLAPTLEAFSARSSTEIASVMTTDQAVFVEDLREATRGWLGFVGAPEALAAQVDAVVRRRAVVTPLSLRAEAWGGVIFMRDDLEPADQPLLSLFALQVGSWLGVVEGLERLDRRTAELELVHTLAVSSTRSDVSELCRRALETVCSTTGADAGALHRFERESGEFVMVGDALGYTGPLAEHYRRFVLPPEGFPAPMAMPVAAMREGSTMVAGAGFRFAALVPLSLEGASVGLLSLFRRAERPFADSELRSAEILGLQMASLLERQRLYLESQRLYADLKASYDELERAQAELVRHERLAALGELAAVMAHEVRNPLGVIFNSLNTLKRLLKPAGDAEMLLTMVGEEAERLNRIVADLLDFARPYELVKKPIALEPFIASAVDAATQTLPATLPVKVVTHFEKELAPFPVDAHLLRQALINLVVNGAQAMPRGGVVTVTARIEPKGAVPWLVMEVRDEGLGLTARATEKMFQPFFTTKATGTGLGLAVVKRIVDSHGGEVTARPNGDKGTVFTIRLPGGSERDGAMTPPRPSPAVPRR
ncbi:MAG: ATP-binding protein [Myxococcaceae bacterium]|jgi:signal transduction histidine kinase|nr:ATP-binding protein [Myxococcaceae bacterium]